MKKITSVAVLAVTAILLWSCNAKKTINDATTFTIDYSIEVDVPANSVDTTGTKSYTTPDVPTTSAARYVTEGTAPNLIDKITITKLAFTNTKGNLDFIKSISISMQASGLPDVVVATKSNIPAGLSTVSCELGSDNIKDYIAKDNFKLKATLSFESNQSTDAKIRMDQSVKVEGKKL